MEVVKRRSSAAQDTVSVWVYRELAGGKDGCIFIATALELLPNCTSVSGGSYAFVLLCVCCCCC